MNETLKNEKRVQGEVTKRQVKANFIAMYKSQLEIVIKITLDEKKKAELQKALVADLKRQKCDSAYTKIISAIDPSDLNAWANQIASDLAEVVKKEKQKKAASAS